MNINYSVNSDSWKYLYVDLQYSQSFQHIKLAVFDHEHGITAIERVSHLALGILKSIPVVGYLATAVDTIFHAKTITCVSLDSENPYGRGLEHGKRLKNKINETYTPILATIKQMEKKSLSGKSGYFIKMSKDFERNISREMVDEMKGLAKGSGYSYEDVLLIHTFLDSNAGQYGCSAMAMRASEVSSERIAAANHSVNDSSDEESAGRRNRLLDVNVRDIKDTEILRESGRMDTIQSIIFNTKTGDIHLSASGSDSSNKKYTVFSGKSVFNGTFNSKHSSNDGDVKLFRNLDWPWYFIGQNTILLTRKMEGMTTVSVTFPGYLGTLSGMNNEGLALSVCQNGDNVNTDGMPDPLLFTHMLDTCKNVKGAVHLLNDKQHGSSNNVVLADKKGAKSLELEGVGCRYKVAGSIE